LISTDDDRVVVTQARRGESRSRFIGFFFFLAAVVSFAIVEVGIHADPRGVVAVLVTGIVAVVAGTQAWTAAVVVWPT